MTKRPVILATLGDSGGIGPELVARSLEFADATADVTRLIAGPRRVLEEGCEIAGVEFDIPVTNDIDDALDFHVPTVFFDYNPTGLRNLVPGKATAAAGRCDLAVARLATDLHAQGRIDGFVFAPVNKLSLKLAGSEFEGYKAYIADHIGVTGKSAEINTIGSLWTTRVSSHIPIAEVPIHVTKENVLEIITYFHRELQRFGYSKPRIAVSGLNPHNGDGGMFGREEIDEIGPAVEAARGAKINVAGPYPPDTVFLTAQQEDYVGIVSMYHDQCQIATKLLGFDEGVTYFGGLPFPVATPAHGTAYDIVGAGIASAKPLVNALRLMRRAVMNSKGRPN